MGQYLIKIQFHILYFWNVLKHPSCTIFLTNITLSASIKQNILFGLPYNRERYLDVINACALARDLMQVPLGDKTRVGNDGVALSGGQKARIHLARAIYKNADIYLLDNSLSALDTHVSLQVYQNCIRGFLKNKIVILASNKFEYLEDANQIILLEEGRVLSIGTFAELHEDFKKMRHLTALQTYIQNREESSIENVLDISDSIMYFFDDAASVKNVMI